jgi:predicted amidohydrolase YtcJ
MILENGRVQTLDPRLPSARAIAITDDGRVAGGVESWEGASSAVSGERIDLDGRTVVPGFVDAHVHFLDWALERDAVALGGRATPAAVLAAVAKAAAAADRVGGWIVGAGWREEVFEGPPTAALLDAVTGDRPTALWAHDHHSLWLNSAALALHGDPGDVPGGVVVRDPSGRPCGVLRENAAWSVALPEPTEEKVEAVARAQLAALARGVTAVHDMGSRDAAGSFGGLNVWQRLHRERRLRLRVDYAQRATHLAGTLATGIESGFGDELLRVGPVKAFLDGTLGSRTAAMLEPYLGTGAAGDDGSLGVDLLSPAEFEEVVREASAGGLRVAVHAIGDRANRVALDAFERTRGVWGPRGLVPRIEHAQLLHPADVARFGGLGVAASVQPAHLLSDALVAESAWGERSSGAYPFASLTAGGALLAFGSDAPIEDVDPLLAVHAAVNRSRPGGGSGWRTAEAIGVVEALRATSVGPAILAGRERRLGTLGKGMSADLVVLEEDPLTCPPERLAGIRVVATMIGGRWVHGRPPW